MTPHYKFTVRIWINGPVERENVTLTIGSKGWSIDEAFELLKSKMTIEKVALLNSEIITSASEL